MKQNARKAEQKCFIEWVFLDDFFLFIQLRKLFLLSSVTKPKKNEKKAKRSKKYSKTYQTRNFYQIIALSEKDK